MIAQAIAHDPDKPDPHANLGLALHALGRVREAEAAYRQALALRESFPEAHNSLGSALQELGRLDEAVAHYRRALDLHGAYPEALANLGTALHARDRLEEAEAALRQALALDRSNLLAWCNLGVVLKECGRLSEAETALAEALRLLPGDPETLVNLGLLREAQGQREEAERCYRQALAGDPGFSLARWNLAILLIGQGRLAEGRDLYESRFDSSRVLGARVFPVPRWDGSDPAGRRIMVWREQGLGDELLYATALPNLIRRAGHVVLECDRRMVSLFARSFPDATVREETLRDGRETLDPLDFDAHLPMASLPRFFRRSLTGFPPEGRYMVPDPERTALWRDRLAGLGPGLKVGICWRSQLTTGERKHAYTGLDAWAPLFRLPGVTFIALQYDLRDEEVADAAGRLSVTLHRWTDADLKNDLETAAALTANLDLVITVASSVGEMAGALGVPVWRFGGRYDWTMQGTACRPFFPSMRMWRAAAGERLGDVLGRMAREVERLRASGREEQAEELLAEAQRLHESGRWPEAEKAYQRVLELAGDHTDALEGYGRLGHEAGRPDIAAELIGRAIQAGGSSAVRHRRRAMALQDLGALAEAAEDWRHAVELGADDAEAQGNFGLVLLALGQAGEAAEALGRAVRREPGWAGLHANLGLALQSAGRAGEVASALRRALALDPALPEGWNSLAGMLLNGEDAGRAERPARRALLLRPGYPEALGNLGLAQLTAGREGEAVESLRGALELRPGDAGTLANLALALERAGQEDRAGLAWWRILLLDPGSAPGFAGLADLRQRQKRLDAALKAWERALRIDPRRADWHYNAGNALQAAGRPAEADAVYRRAVAEDPSLSLAAFNRGYAALARGRLEEGWTGLEARFAAGQARPDRRFRRPAWTGEDLAGRTLLVWREQGVGDELMYASCYPDLIGRAGKVILECDPRLAGLFTRSFPGAEVRAATGDPDDFDVHVAAGSLPLRLRTGLADFPARSGGHLRADPARATAWRERLAESGPGLTVGICWRSRLRGAERDAGYTRLTQWGPVIAVPGVRFVNLQYDECAGEIAEAEARFGVPIRRFAALDLMNDLEEAAALTAALDLVVSAGTSVAEMAGALGVPVWRFGGRGEWTALGTGCRPWYTSMRLFAPPPGGTMEGALRAVARELRRLTQ